MSRAQEPWRALADRYRRISAPPELALTLERNFRRQASRDAGERRSPPRPGSWILVPAAAAVLVVVALWTVDGPRDQAHFTGLSTSLPSSSQVRSLRPVRLPAPPRHVPASFARIDSPPRPGAVGRDPAPRGESLSPPISDI